MLPSSASRASLCGLTVTLLQIALALGCAQPAENFASRYLSLVQHDSFWFGNIIDRGYQTTLPPIDHKEMEVCNVAFFPAYPLLAGLLNRLTHLGISLSLLLVAQLAAWGFWTYFFLFAERWQLPVTLRICGALAVVAHPAAFYLVAGYSESLFLAALAGFLFWCTSEKRGASALAILHGVILSATRIVGLPCALLPLALAFSHYGFLPNEKWRTRFARYAPPLAVSFCSTLGGIAFLAYCQLRWGRWDLYMLTQGEGWGIEADYLAVFKPRNYHFALPSIYDPTGTSQFVSALAAVIFLVLLLIELIAAWRRRDGWQTRLGFYLAAAIIYYISVAGVASVRLESMLRYDLCVHALLVLGMLHLLRQLRMTSIYLRAGALGLATLLFAAGMALQGFYVWNFTQGNWVA